METKKVEDLVKALKGVSPMIREDAAKTLGDSGDPSTIDTLLVFLKDDNKNVRKAAAKGLIKIGGPAKPELFNAIKDKIILTTVAHAYADIKYLNTVSRIMNFLFKAWGIALMSIATVFVVISKLTKPGSGAPHEFMHMLEAFLTIVVFVMGPSILTIGIFYFVIRELLVFSLKRKLSAELVDK